MEATVGRGIAAVAWMSPYLWLVALIVAVALAPVAVIAAA